MTEPIATYIEAGEKRFIASAIEWPGWSRSGRSEADALATLAAYRGRYTVVLVAAGIRPPAVGALLVVTERLAGGASTDFGVAGAAPSGDARPLAGAELDAQIAFLEAAWAGFDRFAEAALGVDLTTGPRGGGRDRMKIGAHVVEAEEAYVGKLGARPPKLPADPFEALPTLHAAALEALQARARGDVADVGERGGKRWSPRYFVRRAARHVLDHAWEIEDRSSGG